MPIRTTRFYIVVGLLLVLVSISGCPQSNHVVRGVCAASQPSPSHTAPGRAYDPQEGFSILPPPGFHDIGPSTFHFMNFLGPAETDFTINFNVRAQDDDGTPIEKAAAKVKRILPLLLNNYAQTEEGFAQIGPKRVYFAAGTFRWGGRPLRSLQFFIRGGNGRVYIITLSTPITCFEKYRAPFEQSVQTVLVQ